MLKNTTILRLKRVLLSDKLSMPSGLLPLLKKDLAAALENYLDIKPESLQITIDNNADGEYDFCINGVAERVKSPKFLK